MPEFSKVIIADREYLVLSLSVKPKKVKSKGKEYIQPVFIAATEEELKELGLKPNSIITLEKLKRKIIEETMKKATPIIPKKQQATCF